MKEKWKAKMHAFFVRNMILYNKFLFFLHFSFNLHEFNFNITM
jgi:hypothetical protein